jgi:predicted DNA-binding transcriptional regulator YafY
MDMPIAFHRPGPDSRISRARAARLYRLLTALANGGRSRAHLIRLGRAGMRTFYRDITLLEEYKIAVRSTGNRYELITPLDQALSRLPFPPPELSFRDVIELAKGRGSAQAKLKAQFQEVTG